MILEIHHTCEISINFHANSWYMICIVSPCQSLMRSEFTTSGPRCIPGWAHVAFNATLVSWPWPCFNGRSLATKETLLMKIRAQKRRLKMFDKWKLERKDSLWKCFRMWNTMASFAGWNATSSPLRRATEERSWETFGGVEAWWVLKSAVARFNVFSHIFQQKCEICLCEHRLLRHI